MVSTPADAQLTGSGDILMATARYGKGTVHAMVDPWLYNEYIDGRKLPAEYDNFAAGRELVRWTLKRVARSKQIGGFEASFRFIVQFCRK